MWGTIAVLAACLVLFFLGAFCVVQAVIGVKLFSEEKKPIFLVSAIIYHISAAIVIFLFLEILL